MSRQEYTDPRVAMQPSDNHGMLIDILVFTIPFWFIAILVLWWEGRR